MAESSIYSDDAVPSLVKQAWQVYQRTPVFMAAFWWLLFIIFLVIAEPWLSPFSPYTQNTNMLLLPPAWIEGGKIEYFLGTDDLGRDVLSRIFEGVRYTVGGAFIAVTISGVVGSILGAAAALLTGYASSILHHLLDSILSIPSLLLTIIVVAILGYSWESAIIAVTLALMPHFTRAMHESVKRELEKSYVKNARLDGYRGLRLLFGVMLPNMLESLVRQATNATSSALLDIAALGFLGLGTQAPIPEWGTMMADGVELIAQAPWLVYLPGLALFMTILSINLVGEGIEQSLQSIGNG